MVTYIRSDLDFILAQIKIAEAHADGQPLYGPGGLIPTYNLAWGLRTVDGTYNNLLHPELGAADNEIPEGLGTHFRTIMVDPTERGRLRWCLSPIHPASTTTVRTPTGFRAARDRPPPVTCSTPMSARSRT